MIRYPGSKDKIVRDILRRFPAHIQLGGLFADDRMDYCEPFFGAGAVGFKALRNLSPRNRIRINDKDIGIAALWQAVWQEPEALCERVRAFTPSVDAFYSFREQDGAPGIDPGERAFQKLALHQLSFSGLGAVAGGPIGGRQQSSEYNVDCRWNASRLIRDIWSRHKLLRRFGGHVSITCRDFGEVIQSATSASFIYVDPPYVDKGPELYKHSMSIADHERLAKMLRSCRAQWVLSYDDHPVVRDLYSWARVESVSLTYTTAVSSTQRRKNSEVIISPAVARLEVA